MQPTTVAAVRRGLLAVLDDAIARVPGGATASPEDVHEVRKALKRARAVLRLLRPALAAPAYGRADESLRTAGKCLSAARDAQVIAALYAAVERETRPATTRQGRSASAPVVTTGPSGADLAAVRAGLRQARAAVSGAALAGSGWAGLGTGFRAVYRQAQRRRPRNRRETTDAAWHAWRRSTKRYWHVLEVFAPVRPRRLGKAVRGAHRLSDLLGDEHDLALLAQWISARRKQPEPADARVRRAIRQRRAALQSKALAVGRQLYEAPPRQAEALLRRDWERWRAG